MRTIFSHNHPLLLAALAMLTLLNGCVIIDLDTEFTPDSELLGKIIMQEEDRYQWVEPLYITAEIKNYVDAVISPRDTTEQKVQKLQDLLFSEEYLEIRYDDLHTRTAVEVFESQAGNCLSVMNLFIAMARYIGLDASFQTVQVRPTWDRRGTLLVINQHINATGRVSQGNTYIVDFTPEIALQQLTSASVSDLHARALYFNNLGVEELVNGQLESALQYFQNALFLDSDLSIGWNNIGTVYNRLKQPELAEYSYQMSFYTDATNATAINNLARFYSARGDTAKANSYRRAISRFNRRNPYFHFNEGNIASSSGDLEKAVEHYRMAIKLKELEPDFYTALANVYSRLGNDRLQRRMLTEASELLADNEEIYRPSDQKVRFIDSRSILSKTSPGLSVQAN